MVSTDRETDGARYVIEDRLVCLGLLIRCSLQTANFSIQPVDVLEPGLEGVNELHFSIVCILNFWRFVKVSAAAE